MPAPSGISIESCAGKSYGVDTTEHSRVDWFGLEGENEKLKEENRKLEAEISKLKK
jgi:cell division protein FtsB